MKNKNYEIKIVGDGTRKDIAHALLIISKAIELAPEDDLDRARWEDAILMTEIDESDHSVRLS